MGDEAARRWFLSGAERGNPDTGLDDEAPGAGVAWSEGNLVRPLVHGAAYFQRLYEELCALRAGDRLFFTDWRGDADEQLTEQGHEIGSVLCDLATAGVEVRGLGWRSHSDRSRFNAQANEGLGAVLHQARAEGRLDPRGPPVGAHPPNLAAAPHPRPP